jgi:PPP family 3-phenylpropionic acid transporter
MPYWRLSGFYFFYFAVLGILVPYWGLYLKSIGFSAVDIGSLMAVLMVSRMVAPNVWAYIADHRRERMRVVRAASFLTVLCFAGVFAGTTFWWLALVMLAFSFFWNASLPVLEVQVMHHTRQHPGRYGRVRLWGSIGFIAAVVVLGPVIDNAGPAWILPVLVALMTGIFVSSLLLPEAEMSGPMERAGPFLKTVTRPDVLAFLLACLLMAASHGPYYTFYSILLESHDFTKTAIGILWAYAVVCEIAIFLLMPRLLEIVSLRQVLLASFALAAARWLLIGLLPNNLAALIVAQTLHAATFGTFHAAGMQMVYRFFTGHHQHRGQAVYSTVGFGLGGAIGAYYSGHAWDTLGPLVTYAIAAGCALGALLVAWRGLRPATS